MPFPGVVHGLLIASCLALSAGTAFGELPRYDVALTLNTQEHRADLRVTVSWHNPSPTLATNELVLTFNPHYRIPEGDYLLLAKTLELLRLNPSHGIDRQGRHGTVSGTALHAINGRAVPGGQPLPFHFRHDIATAIVVELPEAVQPGNSVVVEFEASIRLPNKQGRWGHWDGVTFLTNALPVTAFFDDQGWHPVPFVPWHQPFWTEAGVYNATIRLPADQKLACSAAVEAETPLANGWKQVTTKPFVGRDFAVVASAGFQEYTAPLVMPGGRQITIRCLAFPRHEFYAREMLRVAAEAIPVYSEWFAPFPYDQFTVVESFFGWNGNECGGLVMIDERVFNMPHLARRYVEYLLSHEVCHQWWYNLVGTNGYSETFIDEGAATYFTHRLMDRKHGKNNRFLEWPDGATWLPNIERPNYRYASMYGAIGRGEMPAAAGDLPGFNHLVGLFTGAYDRGSKIFGMIEDRLGEEAFLDFFRGLVTKYSWKVLSAAALRAELEAYTGQDWGEFFERWVYNKGLTDWRVESAVVSGGRPLHNMVGEVGRAGPFRASVVVRQTAEYEEATTVGVSLREGDGFPIRVPVGPGATAYSDPDQGVSVEAVGRGAYRVTLSVPSDPVQIKVDPDDVLLDRNPGDNYWKTAPRVYATPLYSVLNESDLTNDYYRWNVGAGPWVGGALYPDPWYTRSTMVGVRAGAFRTQIFSGGAYAAYRTDFRDLVIGADGLLDHWPYPKAQLGFNVEQRVGGPYGDVEGRSTAFRASAFARHVWKYSSSLYLPPLAYTEAFTSYSDNFFPVARSFPDGARRPGWTQLNGLHSRVNLYTPYWDPECGFWADLTAAGGAAKLDKDVGVYQMRGELAAVRKLPWDLGPLTGTRVAGRVVASGAFPDRGQFFALGGGTLFRGFDLAERQGSVLWVANAELRMPLARELEWDVLDHLAGGRNLWLAVFYDVGAVYSNGRVVGDVAHAIGGGLRLDATVFSFIERVTLRVDVGKTLNAATPVQFWFGVQHAF
jgi:hypothetical protein